MSNINWYTIYNTQTGKITGSFTAFEEMVELNTPPFSSTVSGQYSSNDGYISNGQFVPFPQKPTKYSKFNYVSKQWEPDLDKAKEHKWQELKTTRDQKEYGGFTWNNYVFDSDPIAQNRIQGAVQLAVLDPQTFNIDWTLANNTVIPVTGSEMLEVGKALASHVSSQHVIARNLRNLLNMASTESEVSAINWPN